MKNIIAIDIGGTNIKYGIVSGEGKIVTEDQIPTEAQHGGRALMRKILSVIEEQLEQEIPIGGIGISSAGQICPDTGMVIWATENLPGWTGMPIRQKIQDAFGLPVFVENDVNAAALGEKWMGAGRDAKDFVCLTIGTGIGGAVIINNRIYHGHRGIAGELGHIPIEKNGYPCTCGLSGCLEQYASMTALIRNVKNKINSDTINERAIEGKTIFEEAEKGHPVCRQAIESFTDYLGTGIGALVHVFNPSLIVLGGAVSQQGEPLLKKIKAKTMKHVLPAFAEGLEICFAKCGNHAGLLGVVYGWKQTYIR